MITSMRLKNFKAFQDTGTIGIGPLTVLAGPNSGGKSSIMQSLLLLKQTLEGPSEVDLNLDGRYLQFSNFNELVYGKPALNRSELSLEFDVETHIPIEVVPRFFSDITVAEGITHTHLSTSIQMAFRQHRWDDNKAVVLDQFRMSSKAKDIIGPQLKAKFSKGLYRVSTRGKGIEPPQPFKDLRIKTLVGRQFLPHAIVFEDDGDAHLHPVPLSPIFLNPIGELETEIEENLQYLGPLRERPRRAYLHSGNPMTEIGDSGEYAAQVLWLNKDDMIDYLPVIGDEHRNVTLMEAVNDAFVRLGVLQPVNVSSARSIAYQVLFGLRRTDGDRAVTIADVGFGLSQLLPIVMLGLRSSNASLLMFEQPEIHLHPRLQGRLADFFLTLAEQGRRIIVETHSDHFINRLRRRIAEDQTDTLKDKVNILFVNPPHEGQGAKIDPLRVDRYGVVENWPADFLPEAADEAEAIFAAGLSKRGV